MEQTGTMQKLKSGFQHSFWVANGMELFERLAYYGQATILSVFLRDHLKFNEVEAGQLSSIFGGLIYFLPIFAGALADKFGFQKSVFVCILCSCNWIFFNWFHRNVQHSPVGIRIQIFS